ncbi:MAG: hypothetical protein ACE5RN_07385 [Nitrosopumilaceae archaeon]
MVNQTKIDCTYKGTTITLGPKILQAFDSCKLDEGWAKVGVNVNATVGRYVAIKDGSKAVLKIFNTKMPEILKFRKGATVKLSPKVIQYQEKYRLKK